MVLTFNLNFFFYFSNSLFAKHTTDDPYYCGLRARVPNFVKSSKNKGKDSVSPMKRISVSNLQHPAASLASLHQLHQMHPQHLYASHHGHPSYPHHMMLHTRSFESGIGNPFRNFVNFSKKKTINCSILFSLKRFQIQKWLNRHTIIYMDDYHYQPVVTYHNSGLCILVNGINTPASQLEASKKRKIIIHKPILAFIANYKEICKIKIPNPLVIQSISWYIFFFYVLRSIISTFVKPYDTTNERCVYSEKNYCRTLKKKKTL